MNATYDALTVTPEDFDDAPPPSTVRVRRMVVEGELDSSDLRRGNVSKLRAIVELLDRDLEHLEQDPAPNSLCPQELVGIIPNLQAMLAIARGSELSLLGRVVTRQLAFAERLVAGKVAWCLLNKLALEELVSVVDMVLDVVELVGSDSGCRHEERVSFRILSAVAPQILAEVDGMSFREIRFHQVSSRGQSSRAC